ncbi:MAG: hypothetical protein EXS37_00040 [Opitutus sp.]|nr:hypothetical protein [Opitutus sp.]
MPRAPKEYSRLTPDAGGIGSYFSMWVSADCLITVRSSGYHETYSRVELSEVKAIFLTVTRRRLWWGIVWVVVAGLAVLTLIISLVQHVTPVTSLIFAVPAVIGLLWNHWLGAGCRAYVVTGVQTAELPALARIKKARRVVAKLQPMIATAQIYLVSPPAAPEP